MRGIVFVLMAIALAVPSTLAGSPLIGEWTFLIFRHPEKAVPQYPPGRYHKPVKVEFLSDSTITGNSFRTVINGRFHTSGKQLRVYDFSTGKTALENKWGNLLLQHFPAVKRFAVRQDTLTLHIATGESMVFVRSGSMDEALYDRYTKGIQQLLLPGRLFYFFSGYKPGSKWVYRDEASGTLHTEVVSDYHNFYHREQFRDDLHHSVQYTVSNTEAHSKTTVWLYANSADNFSLILSGTRKDGSTGGGRNCNFSVDAVLEKYVSGCDYRSEFVGRMDLEGNSYERVIKVEAIDPGKHPHLFETAWFAEDIGIIRKEYRNGKVYNLVRHDVRKK